jgi:NMD protein affecting ribosome stability and mRNA decay
MQIDWHRAINDILAKKLSCPRCGSMADDVFVGYLRAPEASDWAPLCEGCNRRESCDARKFVLLCENCATAVRLRGRRVDEDGFMVALLDECRRNLEETLDYLADYWREDLDVDPEEMEKRLDEVDPELFEEENNWRRYLEEQYLKIHGWFRDRHLAIPNPGWRSEYVEDIVGAGYPSLLGD